MPRLRACARLLRLFLVLALGLGMASLIAVGERLGFKASLARRQRWTRMFMQRLVGALPFEVRVLGTLPQRPMLWVSNHVSWTCLLYTSPSPRDLSTSRMPSSA